MMKQISEETSSTPATVATLEDLAKLANYSLMDTLNCDPEAKQSADEESFGLDHSPRQVFSGHYVPVKTTPIESPEYIAHSKNFFNELGFADSMAESNDFIQMFSGDLSQVPETLRKVGWATGYALSIYGTEYIQQCPFQTGNGYGDGRAISVLEGVFNGQRWEMQLKGGGRTPYCRGGDGRAVLRSSVREFLAQEHMHSLGVPTSRSLSLYVSKTEQVQRPWYSPGSRMMDPDVLVSEAVAVSTRVAPSFIRVGQLELFGRRVRNQEHPQAMEELEQIVLHAIDREYSDVIDNNLVSPEKKTAKKHIAGKVILLAEEFRKRLTSLIANWVRVGFCQGNFNSDNCAIGGYTLDYGPFGFCDVFDPHFQSWTGGGRHFAFLNQPVAAQKNFKMFCIAVRHLLKSELISESDLDSDSDASQDFLSQLDKIESDFPKVMQAEMETMLACKLGLDSFDSELFDELGTLMTQTPVDYTIFFRELSSLPDSIEPLKKSFYRHSEELETRWSVWLTKWRTAIGRTNLDSPESRKALSQQMKLVNPKYILREWFVAPAYQQAAQGDYSLVRELQEVMTQPYAEQSEVVEEKYYRLKPVELFGVGGLSHYSCSS